MRKLKKKQKTHVLKTMVRKNTEATDDLTELIKTLHKAPSPLKYCLTVLVKDSSKLYRKRRDFQFKEVSFTHIHSIQSVWYFHRRCIEFANHYIQIRISLMRVMMLDYVIRISSMKHELLTSLPCSIHLGTLGFSIPHLIA